MVKILIADDSTEKIGAVTQLIKSKFADASVSYSLDISNTRAQLYDNDDLDYIDDNEFEAFGGECILDEIERLCIHTKVVIITAFDVLGDGAQHIDLETLSNRIKHEFPELFVGSVFYNATSTKWKEELKELLKKE